jgi:hypothetical protein
MCFNTYFLIFVFLMHYSIFLINIYILVSVGHILTWAKTQVKRKKNPTLLGSFKVSSKTQVNTKSPQSYNLNPTLTKTCVFHRVAGRLGVYLSFTGVFPPQSDYNYGLSSLSVGPGKTPFC